MYTKAKIYNLALNALLLQRQVANPDTETSNEAKVLNNVWDVAFRTVLEDLDLDSTSTQKILELMEANPEDYPEWTYVYKYPISCALFRRIKSGTLTDNRTSFIAKKVGMFVDSDGTHKAIFTNEQNAVAEFVPHDFPLSVLSASAGICIALRLATLASPLIVGKGADRLRKEIEQRYVMAKAEACEHDRRENFNFEDDTTMSEFVEARLE